MAVGSLKVRLAYGPTLRSTGKQEVGKQECSQKGADTVSTADATMYCVSSPTRSLWEPFWHPQQCAGGIVWFCKCLHIAGAAHLFGNVLTSRLKTTLNWTLQNSNSWLPHYYHKDVQLVWICTGLVLFQSQFQDRRTRRNTGKMQKCPKSKNGG